MVTPRSLRRALERKPAAVKAAAGALAGVVGMSAAAYGLGFVIEPYKGNGARSAADTREAPGVPGDNLIASIIDLVPTDLSSGQLPSGGSLYSLDATTDFVLSIVDGVQPPANGGLTPGGGGGGDDGGSGDGDGGNGGNGGLLPWDGGSPTPPPGGGGYDGSGLNVPNLNVGPPTVVTPGLGGADLACPVPAPPPGLAPSLGGSGTAPSEAEGADEADADETSDDPCAADSGDDGGAAGATVA